MPEEIAVAMIPFSFIDRVELEQLRDIAFDSAMGDSNEAEIAAWRSLAECALTVLGVSLEERIIPN